MDSNDAGGPLRPVPKYQWQQNRGDHGGERLSVVRAAREHAATAWRTRGDIGPPPALIDVEVPEELRSVGDLVTELRFDDATGTTTFRITRADPHILVTEALINRLEKNETPYARLDIRHRGGDDMPVRTLTFTQDNGPSYVYVIGERVDVVCGQPVACFQARWPD